jgi:DNA-binding response OmpR family regulator
VRILIVEDEVLVARQIASALTEAGHDPKRVHNGEAALDEVRKAPFDLIVLDIRLPGIDGFEVLRRLRAQHLVSRVLLLTARGEVKDRVTGLQLGADDYPHISGKKTWEGFSARLFLRCVAA